jgi:two-component system, NarL family, nitrate/nitrite response regulator NarL
MTRTILIVDDHPSFRASARMLLEAEGFEVIGEAEDGESALRAIRELQPDVALLGVPLAGLGADRVAHAVALDDLPTRVVLLLGRPDGEGAFEALAEGVAACLTRAVEPDALRRAVAAAARGETVLAPELQTGLAREIRLRHSERGPLLTARERQVIRMIADGRSTAQIARRLHLSPATVKTHIGHAYEKLGVSDRAAAVAASMRRGLLE